MKIIYIANARIPTEKAHGIQIMKTCESFVFSGVEVKLIIPRRLNRIKKDPFDYYAIEKRFEIKKIPCLDLVSLGFGKLGFLIQNLSFSILAAAHLIFKKTDILYSRDLFSLALLSFFKKNIFFEIHDLPRHFFFYGLLLKRMDGVIAITEYLKRFLTEMGVEESKILVAPDAVDLRQFNIKISKSESREKLNLPQDKKIVLYSGHLYQWKGAEALLEATKNLPDVLFIFAGGTEKDVKSFKFQVSSFKLNNVLVVGHRPYPEIPYWLKAADVLVLPNSAKEKISQFYTSPLKLFEYMASGVPIVASDLPSIREILNEDNSVLVEPNNPESLANGIKIIFENFDLADRVSKQALLDVQNYTWDKRAEIILAFIRKTCKNSISALWVI